MKRFSHYLLIGIFLLLVLSSGCGNKVDPPAAGSVQNTPEDITSAYPAAPDGNGAYPAGDAVMIMAEADLRPPEVPTVLTPGTASVSGLLYYYPENLVLTNVLVYLTKAVGPASDQVPPILIGGGDVNNGDMITYTDDKGHFIFTNILPGNYYLVISYANDVIVAVGSRVDTAPHMITLEANQAYALGITYSPQN